jgi:hypothetical protein
METRLNRTDKTGPRQPSAAAGSRRAAIRAWMIVVGLLAAFIIGGWLTTCAFGTTRTTSRHPRLAMACKIVMRRDSVTPGFRD